MRVKIPVDEDGMVGRECPNEDCSPAYFKVKEGTGVVAGDEPRTYCPYCRREDHPNSFPTKEQIAYAARIAKNEALDGVHRMLKESLGLGASGKKTFGGDLLSVEMSLSAPGREFVGRPLEEELRRDVTCPKCKLVHAVFGLATWCPDCGADIFMSHVEAELDVIRRMLGDVPRRANELGVRAGAKDVENALEDLVSIFEAVLKLVTRRALRSRGLSTEDIDDAFRTSVRTTYQGVRSGAETFKELLGHPLLDSLSEREAQSLHRTLEKRHPITHNLGVLDRKYLEKARSGELEGREVRVTLAEVKDAQALVTRVLTSAYRNVTANRDSRAEPFA